MRLAARTRGRTFATIRWTGSAGFASRAVGISTDRPATAAGSAVEGHNFLDADSVPFLGTAPGILVADTGCDFSIVAGRSVVGFTATCAGTYAAVLGADQAVFDTVTFPVAATGTRAVAGAAAKRGYFVHTYLIPDVVAAKRILGADTSLERAIFTSGAVVNFTAGALAGARTAVLRAVVAGFAGDAHVIAAIRTAGALATFK